MKTDWPQCNYNLCSYLLQQQQQQHGGRSTMLHTLEIRANWPEGMTKWFPSLVQKTLQRQQNQKLDANGKPFPKNAKLSKQWAFLWLFSFMLCYCFCYSSAAISIVSDSDIYIYILKVKSDVCLKEVENCLNNERFYDCSRYAVLLFLFFSMLLSVLSPIPNYTFPSK